MSPFTLNIEALSPPLLDPAFFDTLLAAQLDSQVDAPLFNPLIGTQLDAGYFPPQSFYQPVVENNGRDNPIFERQFFDNKELLERALTAYATPLKYDILCQTSFKKRVNTKYNNCYIYISLLFPWLCKTEEGEK